MMCCFNKKKNKVSMSDNTHNSEACRWGTHNAAYRKITFTSIISSKYRNVIRTHTYTHIQNHTNTTDTLHPGLATPERSSPNEPGALRCPPPLGSHPPYMVTLQIAPFFLLCPESPKLSLLSSLGQVLTDR